MTSHNASTGLDLEEHARMLQQQLDEALTEVETWRAEVERIREAATASRSLLADLARDYDLNDHAYTHALFDVVTAKLDAALGLDQEHHDV